MHVERVLYGGDRGDRACLGELRGVDVADAQVPDQAVGAQLRQRGEPLGDRLAAGRVPRADPQVDPVEMVGAELAEVVLHQAAQLARVAYRAGVPSGPSIGPTLVAITRPSG